MQSLSDLKSCSDLHFGFLSSLDYIELLMTGTVLLCGYLFGFTTHVRA